MNNKKPFFDFFRKWKKNEIIAFFVENAIIRNDENTYPDYFRGKKLPELLSLGKIYNISLESGGNGCINKHTEIYLHGDYPNHNPNYFKIIAINNAFDVVSKKFPIFKGMEKSAYSEIFDEVRFLITSLKYDYKRGDYYRNEELNELDALITMNGVLHKNSEKIEEQIRHIIDTQMYGYVGKDEVLTIQKMYENYIYYNLDLLQKNKFFVEIFKDFLNSKNKKEVENKYGLKESLLIESFSVFVERTVKRDGIIY